VCWQWQIALRVGQEAFNTPASVSFGRWTSALGQIEPSPRARGDGSFALIPAVQVAIIEPPASLRSRTIASWRAGISRRIYRVPAAAVDCAMRSDPKY
jgi:hypothetical protein